jgi:hypothetical protein
MLGSRKLSDQQQIQAPQETPVLPVDLDETRLAKIEK